MTHVFTDPRRRNCRSRDHQRNPERAVIGKIIVSEFPVLAQGFSVVSGQDDKGLFRQFLAFQIVKQLPQLRIDIGNFSGVQVSFEFLAEWLRRRIRIVGIPDMNKQEPLGPLLFEPAQSGLDHLTGIPFRRG